MMDALGQEQFIEFGIANERYAIKINDVHEIIKLQSITETPNSPIYVKGVINLRGEIVPIINLRTLFGMPEEAYSKATRIIVVKHVNEKVGIVVDRVNKVTTFADIQPPPERIGLVEGNYFVGIGVTGEQLVGLLRMDHVLL